MLVADAGFDSEPNPLHAREQCSVRTVIPPKQGRPTSKPATGRYRRLMQVQFNQDAYRQRAQVETVISTIKRRQGAHVAARSPRRQHRELRLMALTRNVMILLCWQVFYRAFVTPFPRPVSAPADRGGSANRRWRAFVPFSPYQSFRNASPEAPSIAVTTSTASSNSPPAESEPFAISRQCLARRLPTFEDLVRKAAAVSRRRNRWKIAAKWIFQRADARRVGPQTRRANISLDDGRLILAPSMSRRSPVASGNSPCVERRHGFIRGAKITTRGELSGRPGVSENCFQVQSRKEMVAELCICLPP